MSKRDLPKCWKVLEGNNAGVKRVGYKVCGPSSRKLTKDHGYQQYILPAHDPRPGTDSLSAVDKEWPRWRLGSETHMKLQR